jgi:hypothetical protein
VLAKVAVAAKVANGNLLATLSDVGICDIACGERRGNGVAGVHVSRNSFLATPSGSCWDIWGWSVAERVAAEVCRDSWGDRRGG